MPREWMDVSHLPFNTLLLLEQVQLNWLPGWSLPESEFKLALQANPIVEWYLRHKCTALDPWLDGLLSTRPDLSQHSPDEIRQAEIEILASMTDLLVYATNPAIYDAQPFLNWDSAELLSLADFNGKTVIDVGAGTGRLTLPVAEKAATVFAVEPVTNLRKYLRDKARARNLENVFPVDGLITEIPFPNQFADVTMGGHVFGEYLKREYNELVRVTKPGGMIILCPGNNDQDNEVHSFLSAHDFAWSRFAEPRDGIKRKYWKTVP
jgi:SAM-dependent methyltransferase